MSDRMNFVIFMPDEMRAESVACYGHPLVRTPSIDRLAAEGTRFEQCYVQHTVCTPSRCSMFTGWYPHVSGHRTLWHLLRPHEPNTLKYLKQAGYEVRWYGKNDLLAVRSFPDTVTEAWEPKGKPNHGPLARTGPDDPHFHSFLGLAGPLDVMDTYDGGCVQAGIDFLRRPHDRPFVLYLPLALPHPTYGCPDPWHSMYDPKALPPLRPVCRDGKPGFHEGIRRTRGLQRLGDDDFRRIQAAYLGMVSCSDHLLGRLLDVLDETGLADATTVIFTADHGDWAGDYGLVEKWPSALDDTLTRIPLVIRTPGGKPGHVVDTPVEVFDITPTMLELAGVECRHTHFARSLVPQLLGAAGDASRCAFAEGGYDPHEPHCFEGRGGGLWRDASHIYYPKGKLQQDEPISICRSVMVRDATHKLIFRRFDVCELYDLSADPQELTNLYGRPEAADVQARLERRLLEWYLTTGDVAPWDEDPRGLPPGGCGDHGWRVPQPTQAGQESRR